MSTWMPNAVQSHAYRDVGARRADRVLWIISDLDGYYSAALAARYLNATLRSVHLIHDVATGETVQMLPADRRASYLSHDGIQVLVLHASSPQPSTDHRSVEGIGNSTPEGRFPPQGVESEALSGLPGVIAWVRSLNVPNFWPLGPNTPLQSAPRADGHYIYGDTNDRAIRAATSRG